ncbi:MAG TPA: SDR family oxidoreductase [Firmicutes bacterium]|nr:SDR family oxidoreductase [Bacillota bacterium]
MNKCVVTGGAGFIGSNLTRRLVREGIEVAVVDNLSTGRRENLDGLGGQVRFVTGDVRDSAMLREVFRGAEVVFHQAAIASVQASLDDPATCNAVNVSGTLNVLLTAQACGVRRVVFASSSSVYGDNESLPVREDAPLRPLSPYAVTKAVGELYCRVFAQLFGVDTVALRYFNVFGPRQNPESEYAAVIPKFIRAALTGREPVVYGDGEQSRDFIFVEDVAEANFLAAIHPESLRGQAFNLGGGRQWTLHQVLQTLETILGRPIHHRHDAPRAGEVRHSLADISRAKQVLGFRPGHSFAEGLRATVQWLAETEERGQAETA